MGQQRAGRIFCQPVDGSAAPRASKTQLQWVLGKCFGLQHATQVLEAFEQKAGGAEAAPSHPELLTAIAACTDRIKGLLEDQVAAPAECGCTTGLAKLWNPRRMVAA